MNESAVEPMSAIEIVENISLGFDQVECPTVNRFGPGIWIREVSVPANTFIIGHLHKTPHVNIMLRGSVAMLDGDKIQIIRAPHYGVGGPGRKLGFVIEPMTWLNVYATDETDIDKLEAEYFEKSAVFDNHMEIQRFQARIAHEVDRVDFFEILKENNLDPAQVRAESENTSDLMDMPPIWAAILRVGPSSIEGSGMFSSVPLKVGDIVGPALLDGKRTPLSRYTNHSHRPNCTLEKFGSNVYFKAIRPISGQRGGTAGDEITIDYRVSIEWRNRRN